MKLPINNFTKNKSTKAIVSWVIFLAAGIGSTVWFLIRVIPKPSRASYPCVRASAPFMSAFVLYMLSLGTSVFSFRKFKTNMQRSRYGLAGLFVVLALSTGIYAFWQMLQGLKGCANIIGARCC
ncbi:MAG: hypothetical protein HC896_16785 [Bacteroidales bacterium]|nr:hypothetical protein [Bacteroidales bacterium]